MTVREITALDFNSEVLEAPLTVIVDFWAPWCGPCKMIAPILSELAIAYQDKVKFVKVNIEEEAQLAIDYGIRSIPSLLLFQNGQQKDQIIGAVNKTSLEQFIKQYI